MALGEGVVGRDTGFNLEYGAGPIYAGFGYEKINNSGATTSAAAGNSLVNFAFHYDFGVVKPIFYVSRAKINVGTATPQPRGWAPSRPLACLISYGRRSSRTSVSPSSTSICSLRTCSPT